MPTLTVSLPDACEAAFLAVFGTGTPAGLSGYDLVAQKDLDPDNPLEPDYIVFDCGRQEAKRRPQPGVFDVFMKVVVATAAPTDMVATQHKAAIKALIGHINDKVTTRTTINEAGTGVWLYDYFLDGQQTQVVETGEWETEMTFRLVSQAVDLSEAPETGAFQFDSTLVSFDSDTLTFDAA